MSTDPRELAALRAAEAALIARCLAGEQAAWAEVYRAHAPAVRCVVAAMLEPHHDVEDCVQSVFLTFVRTLERFEQRSSLRTWLIGVAIQQARAVRRSHSRRSRGLTAWWQGMAQWFDGAPAGAQEQLEARRDLEAVQAALGEMDPHHREAWLLRELVGLTPDEAGLVLGRPAATIRTWHFRARGALLAALRPEAQATATNERKREKDRERT
jgi:RNA polymerase sigma-70 factor (ECF subfamily)